jgi:enediyne biosynthesis protein E4
VPICRPPVSAPQFPRLFPGQRVAWGSVGIALFDYNNDGLLDVFLVNGGRITESLHVPESFDRASPRYWNRLYRQNRDGSLTDVTQAAGLANAGNGNYGMGVAVGDYDNDGYPDLFVTSYGKNILYHNNGDGSFTDVTAKAGVAGGGGRYPQDFSITTTMATWTCS